jgi:hypothetical protein
MTLIITNMVENKYRAIQLDGKFLRRPKGGTPVVEFFCSDNRIPMPDPDFLQVHFIISQILHVSEFGQKISWAMDQRIFLDCHGLNPSGSTDVGNLLSKLMLTDVNTVSAPGVDKDLEQEKC